MRTATLDLNSRGSFVDDLNSKPGIVMCRDALLHRSHEIQPAFFDSGKKGKSFFSLFILENLKSVRGIGRGREEGSNSFFPAEKHKSNFGLAPVSEVLGPGVYELEGSYPVQSRFSNRI